MEPERTWEVWTKGILNMPKNDRLKRFTFWEVDSFDSKLHFKILNIYNKYGLAVYWHYTMNGRHYYNFVALDNKTHSKIIRELKPTNPLYPPTTLRIKPNKYKEEKKLWSNGGFDLPPSTPEIGKDNILNQLPELSRFKDWLEHQFIGLIMKNYRVVSYPFVECPNCKEKGLIFCRREDNKFICKVCHLDAVPRSPKK